MRILHYIPSIDRSSGGVGAYLQLLAHDLGRLVELHIVSHRSTHELSIENSTIHYIDGKRTHLLKAKVEFMNLLDELHPDVVHVNSCWELLSSYTVFWAKKKNYPVLITTHGMLEPWIMARHYWTRKLPALWLYQKQALVKADRLHATSESEKQNLLKLGYNNRITVIANGIDVELIDIKTNWKRKKQILFLSRIHVKKGIEFLLEAVAALKDQLEGYTVRIVGEGEEEYIRYLQEKSQQFGIAERIIFCGGVYGSQKWDMFREADLFVLPTYSENFGIVVAEALACGTPVITTTGTPWEELNTQHCGWWIEIGGEPTIQALKEFLYLSEDELELMGRNGRRLVETQYSSIKVTKEMMKMYASLSSFQGSGKDHTGVIG